MATTKKSAIRNLPQSMQAALRVPTPFDSNSFQQHNTLKSRTHVLGYVAEMLSELQHMVGEQECRTLTSLLEVAQREAAIQMYVE